METLHISRKRNGMLIFVLCSLVIMIPLLVVRQAGISEIIGALIGFLIIGLFVYSKSCKEIIVDEHKITFTLGYRNKEIRKEDIYDIQQTKRLFIINKSSGVSFKVSTSDFDAEDIKKVSDVLKD